MIEGTPFDRHRQKALSVILLTYNEAVNLPAALTSAASLDAEIYIVDSGSIDSTLEIAQNFGAHIYEHAFESQSAQLNWALDSIPITTPWILRLDADEWLTPELANELKTLLPKLSDDVTGLEINRRVVFWGRWIRHGGFYPTWLLRVWRTGTARSEQRWMDEHMVLLHGRAIKLDHDFIDENRKGLTFWIDKHNRYADREVKDLLILAESGIGGQPVGQAGRRRWAKDKLYRRCPLFWRALMYWFYRYVIRFGFLDGQPGLVFHFLQAFWYRLLVDAKLYELRRNQNPAVRRAVGASRNDEPRCEGEQGPRT
jgi:glycosyltransferase involved in cell wall biosynthesis